MLDVELVRFRDQLATVRTPEDLFGAVDLGTAKRAYRLFAKIAHEDRYRTRDEQRLAHDAFTQLTAWWTAAQQKFALGTYGQVPVATITSRLGTYALTDIHWGGDLSTLYKATNGAQAVVLKIARQGMNDLLAHEAALLKILDHAAALTTYQHYYPICVESLRIDRAKDRRAVNVLTFADGYVPITEIVATYPEGVHPRHFVWVWNRLLTALAFAHRVGIKHGAVLPPHILINPTTHGLMLVDWAYGWEGTGRVRALSPGYKAWYAPEVLAKQACGRRTDLFMAAESMVYILGGDTKTGEVPGSVPAAFARFLASCLIPNPARRRPDAQVLFDEFQTVAEQVYGPRVFVPLVLAGQ